MISPSAGRRNSGSGQHPWLMLAVFALGCVALGSLSGLVVSSGESSWYASLNRSPLTPPNWAFGVVWTILYLMMGTAAWLVWREHGFAGARGAFVLFAVQLAFNLAWSPAFFGLQNVTLGFVMILPVLVAVALTTVAFQRLSRTAGLLFLPYLAWVAYATAVAWHTWQLNT